MAFSLFGTKKDKKETKSKAADRQAVQPIATKTDSNASLNTAALASLPVIKGAFISEKASRLKEVNQYVFRVADSVSKGEIAKQIEHLYGVTVTGVQIVRLPGKPKQIGRHQVKTAPVRKAIVRLVAGQTINQL